MQQRKTLIVDDDLQSLKTIIATLDDAQLSWLTVDSNAEACAALENDGNIELVLVRGSSNQINGTDLCRRIRATKSREELMVLVILREDELSRGADALIAGASDLLVDPFEPRELRMRAKIVPAEQQRRVDAAHTKPGKTDATAAEAQLFVPEFDPATKRIDFGRLQSRVSDWKNDRDTKAIPLDRIIVCPECESIPTFRPGCGSCGSAFLDRESLIHHFACAHVGPESEFRVGQQLECPKCRMADLIAGSDFEQIKGCTKCTDCNAIFTDAVTLGHCLNCNHRFVAEQGKVVDIVGYQTGEIPDTADIPAPNYQTVGIRANPEHAGF